jgi:hypothetical protein
MTTREPNWRRDRKSRQAQARADRIKQQRQSRREQERAQGEAALPPFAAIREIVEYLGQDGDEREAYESGNDSVYGSMQAVTRWLDHNEPKPRT